MRRLPWLLIFAPLRCRSENRFFKPPGEGPKGDYSDNPVYNLGDTIELQWETDSNFVDIEVLQENIQNVVGYGDMDAWISLRTKLSSVKWVVSYSGFPVGYNSSLSNVYYISMFDFDTNELLASSHYFNISDPNASSSGTNTSPTSSGKPSSPSSTLNISSNEVDVRPGLSRPAVAGIAVGSTIAILLLLGLGVWFWRSRSKKPTVGATRQVHEYVAVNTDTDAPRYEKPMPTFEAYSPQNPYSLGYLNYTQPSELAHSQPTGLSHSHPTELP